MTEKHPKRPRDANQLAMSIVKEATDPSPPIAVSPYVESGRAGGKLGGAARAKSLTPEQRSEIARLAALARWKRG